MTKKRVFTEENPMTKAEFFQFLSQFFPGPSIIEDEFFTENEMTPIDDLSFKCKCPGCGEDTTVTYQYLYERMTQPVVVLVPRGFPMGGSVFMGFGQGPTAQAWLIQVV